MRSRPATPPPEPAAPAPRAAGGMRCGGRPALRRAGGIVYGFCHDALDLLRHSGSSPPDPEQVLQIGGELQQTTGERCRCQGVFLYTFGSRSCAAAGPPDLTSRSCAAADPPGLLGRCLVISSLRPFDLYHVECFHFLSTCPSVVDTLSFSRGLVFFTFCLVLPRPALLAFYMYRGMGQKNFQKMLDNMV